MLNEVLRPGEWYYTSEGGLAWVKRRISDTFFFGYCAHSSRVDIRMSALGWYLFGRVIGARRGRCDLVARVCGSPSFPHPSACPRWYDERKRALVRECRNGEAVLYAE